MYFLRAWTAVPKYLGGLSLILDVERPRDAHTLKSTGYRMRPDSSRPGGRISLTFNSYPSLLMVENVTIGDWKASFVSFNFLLSVRICSKPVVELQSEHLLYGHKW